MELQYVITDGRKYVSKDNNNSMTHTSNVERAEKYPYDKAMNVIKNNMKAKNGEEWEIRLYEPKKSKVKNNLSIVRTLSPAPTEMSLTGQKIEFDWDKIIEQLDNLIDNVYIYKEQLVNAQQRIDWELSDIDHIIQEKSPAAHIRTKIYGVQQQKRKEREKIHVGLRYANVIIESINQGSNLTEIKNRLRGAETKPYKGRTELYDELLEMIG